jgi:hypothetical protein
MSDETVASGTTGPDAGLSADFGGRELTPGVGMLAATVAVTSIVVGAFLAAGSLFGHVFGAWMSPEPVSSGLVGAAMLGVSPGLFAIGRARAWEEVRTLVYPLAIVILGLLAVSLLNAGGLQAAEGGSLVLVLFSLGWVAVLGLLAVCVVGCLVSQYLKPRLPLGDRIVPLPGWAKPLLAVLGSAWFGIGSGLLFIPRFWAGFVPWSVNRPDAQALGVWALALGVGFLGALAEDDLSRVRPALLAVPGVAIAVSIVLGVRASEVDWTSGPGLSLIAMVGGLFLAGVIGRRFLSRSPMPQP